MPDEYTRRAKRYIALAGRRRGLQEKLDEVERLMRDLEGELIDDFVQAGRQRDRLDGVTIYLRREVVPAWEACREDGSTDHAAVVAALEAAGLGELVAPRQARWQSVRALLAEYDREGQPLPPELEGAVRPDERFSIRTRAS